MTGVAARVAALATMLAAMETVHTWAGLVFWLVGRLGLEPRTHGLKVRCSTIELTPPRRRTADATARSVPT